jgi:DUF4097 and DUF4098 domain-containing protein YvlB
VDARSGGGRIRRGRLVGVCLSVGGWSCDETASRAADVSVGDATRIRVRATGTACAPTQEDLERVTLTAERVGTDIVVEAHTDDTNGRLDLTLEVPDTVPLEVEDSSGSLRIYDVAAVDLRDGSGGIDIDGVAGDVRVTDGSGGIDIVAVRGSVTIEDDGSGGIDIADVGGDVIIEEDGSGGIDVADVQGDFIVKRDGSGSVRHSGVAGRVDTPSD